MGTFGTVSPEAHHGDEPTLALEYQALVGWSWWWASDWSTEGLGLETKLEERPS
jgi:hypothetical protein